MSGLVHPAITISVLAVVLWASGCASSLGSVQTRIDAVPEPARSRVHVRLVNSPLDPLRLTRLDGTAARLRRAGFADAKFVAIGNGERLAEDIRHLRGEDPGAAIVLVGWSGGSLACWDALTILDESDERIDAVAYLDSAWIKGRILERGHPTNVDHLLLIYRQNHEPPDVPVNTRVVRIPTINHLAVATHADTLEALADLLVTCAEARGHELHASP